ncbi:hypothetical protein ACFQX6_06255 [Streptosporangium lutulentum]
MGGPDAEHQVVRLGDGEVGGRCLVQPDPVGEPRASASFAAAASASAQMSTPSAVTSGWSSSARSVHAASPQPRSRTRDPAGSLVLVSSRSRWTSLTGAAIGWSE